MTHRLRQWPPSVYPDAVDGFPEALEQIDVALRNLERFGPSPTGYNFKPLGKEKRGLWQLNLRVQRRQIRILYKPYGDVIVVFRIHKKSSPQEQQREYDLAIKRMKEAELRVIHGSPSGYSGLPTIH